MPERNLPAAVTPNRQPAINRPPGRPVPPVFNGITTGQRPIVKTTESAGGVRQGGKPTGIMPAVIQNPLANRQNRPPAYPLVAPVQRKASTSVAPPVYRPLEPHKATNRMPGNAAGTPPQLLRKAPSVFSPQTKRPSSAPNTLQPKLPGLSATGNRFPQKPPVIALGRTGMGRSRDIPSVGQSGVVQPSVKGFFKFLAAKVSCGTSRETSRYRLKASARARFLDSMLTHDVNRRFYAHEISADVRATRLGEARQQPQPVVPPNIFVDTVATINTRGGEYEQGRLTATLVFDDDQLSVRAGENNRLEAELGQDRAGNWFVDVNTLYSFPIGSGVGQILLYEAGYLAVRNGYTRFTLGLGEGEAAKMWETRYREYIINPPEVDAEREGLRDPRPAPKRTILSRNMLIGAWTGLAQYWDKVSCCCC